MTMTPQEKVDLTIQLCHNVCFKKGKACATCPVNDIRIMYITDIDKNMILNGIKRNIITIKGSKGTVYPTVRIVTEDGVKDMALGPFKEFSLDAVIERIYNMAKYNKIYLPGTYCLWFDALMNGGKEQ